MLNYIPFYTHIWGDKKFRDLSLESELLFIYLFGNESITLTGIYEIDIMDSRIARKLGNKFKPAFEEIITKKFIEWDSKEEKIWVVNRFKLIPTKSPKVIAGVFDELNMLGSHEFKEKFISKYKTIIEPFMFRLDNYKLTKEKVIQDEFIINASKLYHSKFSLKRFIESKGVSGEQIDGIINRVLPNLKP